MLRRVLLLRKTSRLEYERLKYKHLNEKDFKQKLNEHGSDYGGLYIRHIKHKSSVQSILKRLQEKNTEVIVRHRESITKQDVTSCDVIIAAGGDGNYLTAASYVTTSNKMLIGINTDPERSEGHLCITPDDKYPINLIVDNILNQKMIPSYRQRIRVDINGTLPVLILNEAFIGETDPSQVSYFELTCEEHVISNKLRSSGLLVYTGTGSTSWAYNVKKVSTDVIKKLFELDSELVVNKSQLSPVQWNDNIKRITQLYNSSTIYNGSEEIMSYVIREPIETKLLSTISHSGTCKKLKVKSRSWNTQLIIDGQYQFKFPNGSEATFSIHPNDSLLTTLQ